jgi:hypothetical protein
MKLSIETVSRSESDVEVIIGDFSLRLPKNPLEISQDAMFWLTLMLAKQINIEYAVNVLFDPCNGTLKLESYGVYNTLFLKSSSMLRPVLRMDGTYYDENSVVRLINSIVMRLTIIKDSVYIKYGI